MIRHRYRGPGVLDVEGADRVAFLQGQLTQEVRDLAPGEVRPAAGLTPKGKLLYVARLVGLPDRLLLLVPAALRAAVTAHLCKYAVFQKVTVSDRSDQWLRLGLYGCFPENLPPGASLLPGEGEIANELLAPVSEREALAAWLAAAGSSALPDAEAEALRVEFGRPRFGTDMDQTHLPVEVGLEPAISRSKGCYVGQEIVARLATYGRVNRRLVGFRFPDGPIAVATHLDNADPSAEGKIEWGKVTSSAISERFGPIGLGFAFRDVPEGGRLVSADGPRRSAVVTALPFA